MSAYANRELPSRALLPNVAAAALLVSLVTYVCCGFMAPAAHCGLTHAVLCLTLAQAIVPSLVSSLSRGLTRARSHVLLLCVIACAGLSLVSASSCVSLILSFEVMLFGALGLLRLTGKTERGVEALVEMYT